MDCTVPANQIHIFGSVPILENPPDRYFNVFSGTYVNWPLVNIALKTVKEKTVKKRNVLYSHISPLTQVTVKFLQSK